VKKKKPMTDDLTIEEAEFLEDQFKRQLFALIQEPIYNGIAYQVMKALFSRLAIMMSNGARADPTMLPTLLHACDYLREYVETATGSAESTPPTFH
jgi:hypothetical protein